jgi:hypothetical protein
MNHARPNFDILKALAPSERIAFLRDHVDACINLTPSGPLRDAMTEANIALMRGADTVAPADRFASTMETLRGKLSKDFKLD